MSGSESGRSYGERVSSDREKKIAMASDRAFTESGRGVLVEW
ncbi:hypothetical protein QUA70_23095 [Microcoleus sp. LAD1_D5]